MRVYNLSQKEVVYKGKRIPPNGGSVEVQGMSFIPDRDLALQEARVLAFGKLPKWWEMDKALMTVSAPAPAPAPKKKVEPAAEKKIVLTVEDHVKTDDMVFSDSKKKK